MPRSRLTASLLKPQARRRHAEEWFLGSLQVSTLALLAEAGPSSVREVVECFPARGRPAYTTVMTVLQKLHEKGVVKRARGARGYVYQARYTSPELRERMAEHLVHELVQNFGDVALAHFTSALRTRRRPPKRPSGIAGRATRRTRKKTS